MGRLDQIIKTKKYITSEEVFQQTNGGLDIFRKEIPNFTTTSNILNVFTNEKNPSARIKQSSTSGLWLFKVYNAGGGFYNAIQFIQKRYNLSFKEAIDYIINQQQLTPVIEHKPIKIVKKEPIFYEVETMPFTKQHTDYYCIGGLTEQFLNNEMDIYAVSKYAINKHVKEPNKDQFMFVYKFRDENGNLVPGKMKFLTLGKNVDKKNKWRNSNDPRLCYYEYKITENTKQVFVVKSNKDCGLLALCGITAIATMSENFFNIKEALERLIKKYPHVEFILNLGSDFQGSVETSIPLSKKFNLKWFNIPKRFLINDINDNFSYTQAFGLKSFKQLLKNKKYL
jgi:hypothetical protein